mmetsp:Transcript_112304/g.195034  ORF Transcript_112304/g.195034 Transcript_112304/m.195034 type:complete len:200 (+) Transcript_112304:464-1063(+)
MCVLQLKPGTPAKDPPSDHLSFFLGLVDTASAGPAGSASAGPAGSAFARLAGTASAGPADIAILAWAATETNSSRAILAWAATKANPSRSHLGHRILQDAGLSGSCSGLVKAGRPSLALDHWSTPTPAIPTTPTLTATFLATANRPFGWLAVGAATRPMVGSEGAVTADPAHWPGMPPKAAITHAQSSRPGPTITRKAK